MHSIRGKARETLEKEAARVIAESIKDLLLQQDRVTLAIPGGRSVTGIFSQLKTLDIDWHKVHIFMVDERLVPIDHDDSNFKLANDTFIRELITEGSLPAKNVHPFGYDEKSEDKGIAFYEEQVKDHGGSYDIILLSAGEDCHVGALYPNHSSIKDDAAYYLTMDDSPKPPKGRMTASKNLLLSAKVALILFVGENKRKAYEKFLDEEVTTAECPAKIVAAIPEVYVVTDL